MVNVFAGWCYNLQQLESYCHSPNRVLITANDVTVGRKVSTCLIS